MLPKRKPNSHKGNYGKTLIVAGSAGMLGAAVLASRAALKVGSGLTYLAVPRPLVFFANLATPEVITLSFHNIENVKATAVAIGPGMGRSATTLKLLKSLISRPASLVIDADALNVLAKAKGRKLRLKAKDIITPHPGEMARLIGHSVKYIQANRLNVAKAAAKRFGCLVVLKGNQTIVASPTGRIYVNQTGNPGMAKGGTGDVLTGMIAGLAAQGWSAWDAAVTGVCSHGLAGDLAAKEKGEYSVTASDIIGKIHVALQRCR
jgi:NAD(P)H-hydrate epimerase